MKHNLNVYNKVAMATSQNTTKRFSTSFSWAIKTLEPSLRDGIYAIYGFVRVADEIVDSWHGHNQADLLDRFEKDTFKAIEEGISTNPILHSFQWVVNTYKIDHQLIKSFLHSMRMDLSQKDYNRTEYDTYIYGSAEVVGLMCMFVFCMGNLKLYENLRPQAQKLGAAFQKINFLRDLKDDFAGLGRIYFPNVNMNRFDEADKKEIEKEIETDFAAGLEGIKKLPVTSRLGVYLAYLYFYMLFTKIKRTPASKLTGTRIRINNGYKLYLLVSSYFRNKFSLITRPTVLPMPANNESNSF